MVPRADSLDLEAVGRELRAHGLRLTRLKRRVLRALAGQPMLSAEQLGGKLGLGTDLSPLYRCLASLEEADIVSHLYLDDGSRHYALAEPFGGHQDIIICKRCAAVRELADCCLSERATRAAGRDGFLVESHQVILRGLCPSCREATG